MYFAIGVEPTKLTAAMSLWVNSASTASLSPWTTVKTPSGRPASFHICARKSEAEGSFSLGFRMKALPQAMALAHIHSGTITGTVSYTHLRAHETDSSLVCRLLLEKKKKKN